MKSGDRAHDINASKKKRDYREIQKLIYAYPAPASEFLSYPKNETE
ncbi:MAG: hypothetical protein ACI9HY_003589 [Planctomycetaceae bacterium]